MGKNLRDLGLKSEKIEGPGFDDMPEQFGAPREPIPPGSYRFQLPADLSQVWDVVDTERGQRITAILDADHPLVIVQSPKGEHDKEDFFGRLSNVERARGREKILVSDLDYLLKALGEKARPQTNLAYIQALQKYAGKTFGGDVEYQWSCNPNRDIWADDGQGGTAQVTGQKGCGARYYQGDVPKNPDGSYPLRIKCGDCGASLRAFSQIARFHP